MQTKSIVGPNPSASRMKVVKMDGVENPMILTLHPYRGSVSERSFSHRMRKEHHANNETLCSNFECSHRMQARLKDFETNLNANLLPYPV